MQAQALWSFFCRALTPDPLTLLLLCCSSFLCIGSSAQLILSEACNPGTAATCPALVVYRSPGITTISNIGLLFNESETAILGQNNFTAPVVPPVVRTQIVYVPLECSCSALSNTRFSLIQHAFSVDSDANLEQLANLTYNGLTNVSAIQQFNNLSSNDSAVVDGQDLTIPIPCACGADNTFDDADAVFLTYALQTGDTLDAVTSNFNLSPESVVEFNKISNVSALKAGDIIGMPISACLSSSLDEPITTNSYVITGNGCVKCSCSLTASGPSLDCQPSGACAPISCPDSNLTLGESNVTLSQSSAGLNCSTSCSCEYRGYSNETGVSASVACAPRICTGAGPASSPALAPFGSVFGPTVSIFVPLLSPFLDLSPPSPAPFSQPPGSAPFGPLGSPFPSAAPPASGPLAPGPSSAALEDTVPPSVVSPPVPAGAQQAILGHGFTFMSAMCVGGISAILFTFEALL